MSNINDINNMDITSNFINDTYDKLSYFDLYGNSVIIFIFMTLFVSLCPQLFAAKTLVVG